MKRLLIILISCCFSAIYSQTPVDVQGFPSPNTTSLGTINEVPVSLYTGKCNISIPLFELKEGDITVPIYLSYNSSGVKPDVHPGWVGLNWALQAGGIINRTVRGIPDETKWKRDVEQWSPPLTAHLFSSNGYLHNSAINTMANWDSYENIRNKAAAEHWIESEPDEFSFNINGNCGTFYIGEDLKIHCQSSPEIKVEMGSLQTIDYPNIRQFSGGSLLYEYKNISNTKIRGFKITMPDGIEYEFGYYSEPYSADRLLIEYSIDFFEQLYQTENWNTWLLRKIKSPNGFEVTFNYQHGQSIIYDSIYNHPVANFMLSIGLEKTALYSKGFSKTGSKSDSYVNLTGEIIFPVYLSSIESSTQKIDFSKSKTTELQYYYPFINDHLNDRIIKTYGPYEGVSPRSFLTDIYGFNWTWKDIYNSFQWFKLDKIEIYSKLESHNVRKWKFGYNNDSTERLMLLSLKEVGVKTDAQNRETEVVSNPYTFEYECYYGTDKYPGPYKLPGYHLTLLDHWGYYNNTNSNISSFTSANMKGYYSKRNARAQYLFTGQLNKINYPIGGSVEFTYEPNQYSTMIKRDSTNGNFESQDYSAPITGGGLRIKNIKYKDNEQVKLEKNYVYSAGILGQEIKYYWPNYKGKLLLSPELTYTCERFVSQNLLPLYGGLDYSISYPKVEEVISGLGKIEYYYSNHFSNPDENFIETIDSLKSIMSPYSSKDFERGKLLRKITRDAAGKIKKIEHQRYSKNSNVTKEYLRALATTRNYIYEDYAIEGSSYKIYTYPYVLASSTDSTFDINGSNPIVNKTDYRYNSYNFLSESSALRSNGKKQSEKYIYPFEVAEGTDTAVMRKMTRKNILAGYRDKIICLDSSTVIKGEYRKFKEFFPNVFKPERVDLVQSKTTLSNWRSLLKPETYYRYNNRGNLVEIKSANNNLATTYLWSYKNQYPVAEIKNATYDQVEAIMSEGFIDTLENKPYRDWKADLELMDLAVELPDAQITNLDYYHLIGKYYVEDPRGITTNYEYDSFGRLKTVKDKDFKILKENAYHYKKTNSLFNPQITVTKNIKTGTLTYSAIVDTSIDGSNTYYWDFGDGSSSSIQNGNHSYLQPATYIVYCKVVNSVYGVKNRSFVLEYPQIPPVPSIKFTCYDIPPYYIQYQCSSSYDIPCSYEVNFGDGSPPKIGATGGTTNKSGTYTITVTATSPFHGTGSYTETITLNNVHAYWDIKAFPYPDTDQELLQPLTVGVDINNIPVEKIHWYETIKRDLHPNIPNTYAGPEYITYDYKYDYPDCLEIEVYCIVEYGGVRYITNPYGYVRDN